MEFKRLFLMIVAFYCGSTLAQDYEKIVEDATARNDNSFLENWSFVETRTTDDVVRVASFDPGREVGNGWQLVSINGEEPDDEEIEVFQSEKAKLAVEREENQDKNGLLEMIAPGSLELLEETPEFWRFGFQPRDENDEAMMEHVAGELNIRKQGLFVHSMEMRSRNSFKPRAGVKIREFKMQMRFTFAGENGPVVPLSLDSYVSGKAFLVATIEENVLVEYSDYQQVK